jgi:hypothetical protein
MGGRQFTRAAVDAILSIWLLFEAAPASARTEEESGQSDSISVLGPKDPSLVRAVTLAVHNASRRLETAACREIFGDFSDRSGLRLASKLEASRQNGRDSLRWLIFRNGSHEAYCDRTRAALAAQPGSRFVVVCGMRFIEIQASDPGYAAALVIHEELHILGLGENPPSSAEITKRVVERCGR